MHLASKSKIIVLSISSEMMWRIKYLLHEKNLSRFFFLLKINCSTPRRHKATELKQTNAEIQKKNALDFNLITKTYLYLAEVGEKNRVKPLLNFDPKMQLESVQRRKLSVGERFN